MFNDKTALIKSMSNLLKHITNSRQAQQQIFDCLQLKDFQKIVNNLTDPISQLRLASACLIGQLLKQNQNLQRRFCENLNIHFTKDTEIIINTNFDKIIESYPQRSVEIFKLLKNHNKMIMNLNQSDILLWFINPQKQKLKIQYLSESQISNLIETYHLHQNPEDICFDPIYCIFGVIFNTKNKLESQRNQSIHIIQQADCGNFCINFKQKTQPSYFQPYIPRMENISNSPRVSTNLDSFYKRNIQGNLISLSSPISVKKVKNLTQSSFNNDKLQACSKASRKISLTENRKKNMQQFNNINYSSYTIGNFSKNNLTDRVFMAKKDNQQISKNFNFSQICSPRTSKINSNYFKQASNDAIIFYQTFQPSNKKQHEGNYSFSLVAPSLKVKSMTINGRHGWKATRNLKHQTPADQANLIQ